MSEMMVHGARPPVNGTVKLLSRLSSVTPHNSMRILWKLNYERSCLFLDCAAVYATQAISVQIVVGPYKGHAWTTLNYRMVVFQYQAHQ